MAGSSTYSLLRLSARARDSVNVASLTSVAAGAAIATGIVFRLRELLSNRSLTQDEAQLVLNIIDRPFTRLFGQLDYNQAAPHGFLAVQKLVTASLGTTEYALRLFPFTAGTVALVLMFFLARAVVSPVAVPVALGVFAVSDPLIGYTASAKQYAIDVVVTVVVLLVALRVHDRGYDSSWLAVFAGVGATAIWLSHPSVFVLAGVSTAFTLASLAQRRLRDALRLATASAAWLLSFGLFVVTSLGDVEGVQRSLSGTPGAFGTSASTDSQAISESLRTSLGAFRYVAGVPHLLERGGDDAGEIIALLIAALCIAGFLALAARDLARALALMGPLALMLVAWGFGQYPLLGRTQLFLAPIYGLLLAEGIVAVVTAIRHRVTRAVAIGAAGLLGAVLLFPAAKHFVHPSTFHEIKPVLEYIAREQRRDDTIYVYYTAQPQLRYYLECGCAGPRFKSATKEGLWPLRRGPGGPDQWSPALRSVRPRFLVAQKADLDARSFAADVDALRGQRRVWALIPEVPEWMRIDLLNELDRAGTRRAKFAVGDVEDFASAAVVYLYDMRRSSAPK